MSNTQHPYVNVLPNHPIDINKESKMFKEEGVITHKHKYRAKGIDYTWHPLGDDKHIIQILQEKGVNGGKINKKKSKKTYKKKSKQRKTRKQQKK